MGSKHLSHHRLYPVFVAGALALAGCTDGDFSFDNIDATMGFGGDSLVIPNSSTENIQLKDVLELEQDGSVELDGEGNYVFKLAGADVAPAKPFVEKIKLNPGKSTSQTIYVPAVTGEIKPITLATYEYHGNSSEVIELDNVLSSKSPFKLTFNFPSDLSKHVSIKTMTINMPGYLMIDNNITATSGTVKFDKNNNTLTLNNVNTASPLVIYIPVMGANFKGTDTSLGKLSEIKNGKIDLNGEFKIGLQTQTVKPSTNNYKISIGIDLPQLTITQATGRFNPKIDITNFGSVNVNGVPDFLSDGNVKVDLYNPQILFTVNNNMDIAATISKAKIISYKQGSTIATVSLPDINIHKNTVTKICVCRKKTDDLTKLYGAENVYVVPNLSDIVYTIPDIVKIDGIEVKTDVTQTGTIEFGKQYNVKPSYKVNAPLAFSENASIVYTDNFDGWNDDIKNIDLSEKTYLLLTGDAESKLPMYLTVGVKPIDVNCKDISEKINLEIPNKVIGSSDGETPAKSNVIIKVTQKEKGALKELDGIKFTVTGSAKTDGKNPIEGITLNASKHTLKLNNIKVKLVGTVIADFN